METETNQPLTSDEFICVSCDNGEEMTERLTLEKNKKLFEIRREGKRLWIKIDGVTVKYPFNVNQYRPEEGSGTFVIYTTDGLRNVITLIDEFVKKEFDRMYLNKICENIMLTENALKEMFRDSLYEDTLRLNVNQKNCGFFRSDGTRIPTPNVSDILREDITLGIVIEPAFVWMYNKKIGVHWDARQIKLAPLKLNGWKKGSLFADDDKKKVTRPSKEMSQTTASIALPDKGSFKNMFDDD